MTQQREWSLLRPIRDMVGELLGLPCPRDDAQANEHWAFKSACAHGHLLVAQWIAGRFGLTVEDTHGINLRRLCDDGHHSVLEWLEERFGV